MTLGDESALQASSARKAEGDVTEEDLLWPEDERTDWGKPKPAQCGQFVGIEYEYLMEGVLWRRWYLRHGQVLLFVTYNASPQLALAERQEVNSVLATLRAANGEA